LARGILNGRSAAARAKSIKKSREQKASGQKATRNYEIFSQRELFQAGYFK